MMRDELFGNAWHSRSRVEKNKNSKPHAGKSAALKMSTSSEIVPKIDTQPYLTQFSWPAQFLRPE